MTNVLDKLKSQCKANVSITSLYNFRNIVRQAGEFYLEKNDLSFASSDPFEEKILQYLVKFKDLDFSELVDMWLTLNSELKFGFVLHKEFKQRDLIVSRES